MSEFHVVRPEDTEDTSASNLSSARVSIEDAEDNAANNKRWEFEYAAEHVRSKALSANSATWPSRLTYKVHQASIMRVLGASLSRSDIRTLQNAVYEADNYEYQTMEMSYRHAMTPSGLSKEARCLANEFVRNELQEARRLNAAGNRQEVLRHLGFAMHAMQDSTSPAHHGFREYHGGRVELAGHMWEELFDPGPGSQLDVATERAYKYFTGELPMPNDFFADLSMDRYRC